MSITRVIAAASIGLALAGCSSGTPSSKPTVTSVITITVPPPPTPMPVALGNWLSTTKDHMDAIVQAANAIVGAGKAENVSGVGAACQKFHDGVQGLQGHMPTPDPQLTTALQAALSDYDAGTHFCIAGTQDYDVNELQHTATFLQSANNYMEQATAIINRDMGTNVTIG
jgi:hypothetical protein